MKVTRIQKKYLSYKYLNRYILHTNIWTYWNLNLKVVPQEKASLGLNYK